MTERCINCGRYENTHTGRDKACFGWTGLFWNPEPPAAPVAAEPLGTCAINKTSTHPERSRCVDWKPLAEPVPQSAERIELAEPLYKALMAIMEFHGHCWCGECDPDFKSQTNPHGYTTFICSDTKKAIEEYRASLAAPSPAETSQANEEQLIQQIATYLVESEGEDCVENIAGGVLRIVRRATPAPQEPRK